MTTPPPAVPGIAHANSSPPSPVSRALCRQTAFVAPPPATRPVSMTSTPASSPSSRSTTASTPSSHARRFEPSPTGRIGTPSSRANRSASRSSATERGRASARAGPPTPIVVSLAIRKPCSIALTPAARPPAPGRSATALQPPASRSRLRAGPMRAQERPHRRASAPSLVASEEERRRARACR